MPYEFVCISSYNCVPHNTMLLELDVDKNKIFERENSMFLTNTFEFSQAPSLYHTLDISHFAFMIIEL